MGRIGKISVIPKDFSTAFPTMEASLRMKGYSRYPGVGTFVLPAQRISGEYITGLDENAPAILDLIKNDKEAGLRKQKEVKELREKLEKKLRMSLAPDSDYYNFRSTNNTKVDFYKLTDGDNIFNLDPDKHPWQVVTYAWISALPQVASSFEAYERGEYPSDTQFFVNDEDIESDIKYRKHKVLDDAVTKFGSFSVLQRKKILRCMGVPITDDVKEVVIYNMFKDIIVKQEMPSGPYKGMHPVTVFGKFADIKKDELDIRDLVEQALLIQIYRIGKGAKVYEGETVAFESKEEMLDFYLNDKNQQDLFELQKRVKVKDLQNS